jgi:hypothetical protein
LIFQNPNPFPQWCVGASPLLPDNQTDYTPFYSNPKCISLVQNTIGTFLNRTNTGAQTESHAALSVLCLKVQPDLDADPDPAPRPPTGSCLPAAASRSA